MTIKCAQPRFRRRRSAELREIVLHDRKWRLEFLERDGLGVLLESLERLCERRTCSVADTLTQTQCVECIRAAINSPSGLQYIVERPEYTRQMANILTSHNTTVKLQVFELLCAVCMASSCGHNLALDALHHFKVSHGHRYRFEVIIDELRNANNPVYKTTLLAFINCLILGCSDLQRRNRIRKELIGLGLGGILNSLRSEEEEELCIQLAVFDENQHCDEDQLGPQHLTHQQLFETVFYKVMESPQALSFHALLLNLSNIDPADTQSDHIWQALEDLSSEAVPDRGIQRSSSSKQLLNKTRKNRRYRRSRSVGVPTCLDVSARQSTCCVATQTETIYADAGVQSDISSTIPLPTPIPESSVLSSSSSSPPPPPPPMPGMAGPPPPPPMPGMAGPPPPPPMPGMAGPPPPPPPPPPLMSDMVGSVLPPPFTGLTASDIAVLPFPTSLSMKQMSGYMTCPSRRSMPSDLTDGGIWTSPKDKFNTMPSTRRKMKTINWTKIPVSVIDNSMWKELPDKPSKMSVDFAKMEELFCQRSAANKRPKSAPGSVPMSSNSEVNLLDSKRSLAVNIFLKQFKKSNEEIVEAIQDAKCDIFGAERLRNLLRLLPERNELAIIKSYPGDPSHLGAAEKFFLKLEQVPGFATRVEAMLLREEFPSRVSELRPQLQSVIDTCDQLMDNESLKQFLILILQLGNYLNAGSYAGNAAGFKLNTLPKLLDTRANKPRVTFLHYAVEVAENANNKSFAFIQEMNHMKELAKLSLELLEDEVKRLSADVHKVNTLLKDNTQGIHSQFVEFLESALECTKDLEQMGENVKVASAKLAQHFCEDPAKFQPEECFKLFADFFHKITQALVENEQRRKQEERAARRETEKLLGNTIRSPKARINRPRVEETCLIDCLMEEIRSGNFKLRRNEG